MGSWITFVHCVMLTRSARLRGRREDRGAALQRLNWMGDTSEQGMARSAGLRVNYVYWLAEGQKNQDRYIREHFEDLPEIRDWTFTP